jgi:hypothetical protein
VLSAKERKNESEFGVKCNKVRNSLQIGGDGSGGEKAVLCRFRQLASRKSAESAAISATAKALYVAAVAIKEVLNKRLKTFHHRDTEYAEKRQRQCSTDVR